MNGWSRGEFARLTVCLFVLVYNSPELVARLGPDYSIYAYDYSEPDVPLVGCGMLSWAMLNTEGSATRMMVTGRVNSNAFVFLGNNNDVRETLEVKIKLQKVDTFTQEQFVSSVHAYQALSRTLGGEFDAARWSGFLNDNPRVLLMTALPAAPLPPPPPPPPSPLVRPATAPPLAIPDPPQMATTLEWKESSVSSSEDVVEPPKKRRRMPAKPHGPKKKAPVMDSEPEIPAVIPSVDPGQMSDVPLPPPRKTAKAPRRQPAPPLPPPLLRLSRSRESLVASQPSISRQSTVESTPGAISEIAPSPRPTGAIASSPPAPPDNIDTTTIPSPAPTSPVLPFLPAQPRDSASRRLETLLEEPGPSRVKEEEPQSDLVLQLPQLPQSGLLLPAPPPPSPQEASKPIAPAEDVAGSSALSPEHSQLIKVSAKPKKSKKKDILTSEAVAPSNGVGDDGVVGGKRGKQTVTKPSRTAAHVKARIEMQLIESVQRGEMPSYCQNCGAIETAVWRKVAPPAENPDETEKAGQIRREKEILLCNACGLWFMSHKTMRPQSLWESNDPHEKHEKPEKGAKAANSRKRKKSAVAPTPPSLNVQISEAPTEPIVLADDEDEETPRAAQSSIRRIAMTPSANRSGGNSEWKAAININRRAACSSPLATGSADSPIDLDAVLAGMPSPKRTLFPEARKSSPEKPVGLPMAKRASGKENLLPEGEVESSQETTSTVPGPTTPTRRATGYQLRTPMRSTMRSVQQSTPSKRSPRPPRNPKPPPSQVTTTPSSSLPRCGAPGKASRRGGQCARRHRRYHRLQRRRHDVRSR